MLCLVVLGKSREFNFFMNLFQVCKLFVCVKVVGVGVCVQYALIEDVGVRVYKLQQIC